MKAIGLVECESQRTQTGYVYADQSESLFGRLFQSQNVRDVAIQRHVGQGLEISYKFDARLLYSCDDNHDHYRIHCTSSFHGGEMIFGKGSS